MFQYKPHFIPSAIYVVGCGGTGSRLVPMLTQLVKTTMRVHNPGQGWIEALPIFLVDDDIVETKNLMRQNFIAQDVGQHKAVVLANRYSRGFGIPLYPCTSRITGSSNRLEFLGYTQDSRPLQNVIVILAVDSPQARRDILAHCFHNFSNIFVIDAGNEDTFGQVRFFTDSYLTVDYSFDLDKFSATMPKMIPKPVPTDYIPFPGFHYQNLGTSASEKSCADLDQTLSINSMMATLMCGVLQNFLYVKPMTYHEIRYALDGAIATTYNTAQNWLQHSLTDKYKGSIFPKTTYREVATTASIYRDTIRKDLLAMKIILGPKGDLLPVVEQPKPVAKTVPAKKKVSTATSTIVTVSL